MTIYERIRTLRTAQGMSQEALAKKVGYEGRSAISKVEKGDRDVSQTMLFKYAEALGVTPAYLLNGEEAPAEREAPNAVFLDQKNVYMIPLYETVSAGLGAYAVNQAVDYIPLYIPSRSEAEETFCITVTGDSMYPKIEEGDVIQVHKQESVDSGTIAVVLLDGEEGLVKRIEYGKDRLELHSINPMYPPMRFEGPEMQRIRIVGAVKKIIKNV